jgi:hypothetical protein
MQIERAFLQTRERAVRNAFFRFAYMFRMAFDCSHCAGMRCLRLAPLPGSAQAIKWLTTGEQEIRPRFLREKPCKPRKPRSATRQNLWAGPKPQPVDYKDIAKASDPHWHHDVAILVLAVTGLVRSQLAG